VAPGQARRAQVAEPFDAVPRPSEPGTERTVCGQRECFGQVPEQLMQAPHDRERGEAWRSQSRVPSPVLAAEGALGDLLTGSEAVVGRAAREAPLPEPVVDAAPEIRQQVRTRLPGRLVDREIGR